MNKVSPVPKGYATVTPYLSIRDAARALDFYKQAFGAEEVVRMPGPGGTVMHAEVRIGGSMIMLGEESPAQGSISPQTLGGSATGILLYVSDVDASYARAVEAGCTAKMPPTDMFWGDRYGNLVDPFGHKWSIATHKEDVSAEETGRRAVAAGMGNCPD